MKNDYTLLENLDEKYFSDILKLLLTTKGVEKGFRTKFANEFVKKVYNDKRNFALANSSVFREYPLNLTKRRTKNIDLLFFDLDNNDDVIIGIENKFLGHDSKEQLDDYFRSLCELFPEQYKRNRIKILYLTLDGREPVNHLNQETKDNLICLSWIEDIKSIVEYLSKEMSYDLNSNILEFIKIINLITTIQKEYSIQVTNNVNVLSHYICKILDLNDSKNWEIHSNKEQNSYTIYRYHKNNKKTQIKINVAFYGHYYALEYFKKERFFIPINLNIEQAIHFIKIFCKKLLNKELQDLSSIDENIGNIFSINKGEQENMFKNAIYRYLTNKLIITEDI